jgi:hypothetical protein
MEMDVILLARKKQVMIAQVVIAHLLMFAHLFVVTLTLDQLRLVMMAIPMIMMGKSYKFFILN